MRTMTRRLRRGFALPLMLWLIAILMTMVAVLAYSAKVGHIEARAQFDRVQAEAAARAGIAYAVARNDRALGSEAWGPSMTPRRLQLDGWDIQITLRDEAGKFDLNQGDPDLLAALMQARQVPAEQRARIVGGLQALRRDNTGIAPPLPAVPGAPPPVTGVVRTIASVSELRQWPGVSAETLARIGGELTVHGNAAQPEWRLASPAMREALTAIGRAGTDTSPAAGPEFGSGTYAIESIARRPGRPPGRVFVVLRAFPRASGGMASVWLAWEHGSWGQ